MKKFILTLDYELYGNGSGDVFRNVVNPTQRLLEIARELGIKYTFFFEVCEYWKLKHEWEKGNHMGYDRNPVEAMEAQMRQAVVDGHDVQLHIHPQWCNARWNNGGWIVDNSQWRLVDYKDDLSDLLLCGKLTIEEIIRPVMADYKCIALRAGGYNAQPSDSIVKAMRNVGLSIDSSVVPGAVEMGELSNYDYSASPLALGIWHVDDKLEQPADSLTDLIELPIVSSPILRIKKILSWSRLLSILHNRKSAISSFAAKTKGTDGGPRGFLFKQWSRVKYLFETEYQTWDFCLFSPSMHKKYVDNAMTENRDVYTLVGHPKGFTDRSGLLWLIDNVNVHFETLSSFSLGC